MKEIKFTIYDFDELSEEAQKVAVQTTQSALVFDDCDCMNLTEWFSDQLRGEGLPGEDVRWSLSSCQGDGVAFYGRLNLDKFEEAHPAIGPELRYLSDFGLVVNIEKRQAFHMYNHHNTMVVSADYDENYWSGLPQYVHDLIEERIQTVLHYVHVRAKEVSLFLENQGYEEIYYKTGEEFAKEEVHLHHFNEDGTIYERFVY